MWMNWVMDWATSSARFLLNNHMGRTQRFATNGTLSSGRKLALSLRARQRPDSRKLIAVTFLQNRWTPLHTGYAFFFTSIQDDSGFLLRQIAHSMRSSLSPHLRAPCC